MRRLLPRLIRWILVIGLLVLANVILGGWLRDYTAELVADGRSKMLGITMAGLLGAYALLLAIPFVPGAEIGISLLMSYGRAAAPYVYLATVMGLCLSYAAGLLFSERLACELLRKAGMHRACAVIEDLRQMTHEDRLRRLEDIVPGWARPWALQRRYIGLALLLNLPGNSLIGGGGGIMFVAGLSRVFPPLPMLLTVALATAPVPAAVYLYGPGLIG